MKKYFYTLFTLTALINYSSVLQSAYYNKENPKKIQLYKRFAYSIANELKYAIHEGNINKVKILLKRHPHYVNKDLSGGTALHYACFEKQIKIVELLLKTFKANANFIEKYSGQTPLHKAVIKVNNNNLISTMYIIDMLLDYKANINATTNNNESILHYILKYTNNTSILYRLISYILNNTHLNIVNINIENKQGDTPFNLIIKYPYNTNSLEYTLLIKMLCKYKTKYLL